MNPKMLKAMRAKKKRAVDPNAPPRPNLLQHDVKIRNQQDTISLLTNKITQLEEKISGLNSKMQNQTNYLQALHNQFQQLKNK